MDFFARGSFSNLRNQYCQPDDALNNHSSYAMDFTQNKFAKKALSRDKNCYFFQLAVPDREAQNLEIQNSSFSWIIESKRLFLCKVSFLLDMYTINYLESIRAKLFLVNWNNIFCRIWIRAREERFLSWGPQTRLYNCWWLVWNGEREFAPTFRTYWKKCQNLNNFKKPSLLQYMWICIFRCRITFSR